MKNGYNNTEPKKNNGDTLFDPSVDMMVNDFDDERTLEEEEAIAARESEDSTVELSNLQREGDMPLDQLLALYGYGVEGESHLPEMEQGEDLPDAEPNDDVEEIDDAEEIDDDLEEEIDEDDDDEIDVPEASSLQQLYATQPIRSRQIIPSRLLRSGGSRAQSEEDSDGSYSPDEDEPKKTIMVGGDYQAVIPEGLCSYDDALPYENDDKLLWDPAPVTAEQIESYLRRAKTVNPGIGVDAIPCGTQLRDDEQALFLMQQCGHNIDEALRRISLNATNAEKISLWSEDECRNFETGLRTYGKNFYDIQLNKVRTRSVSELVQFYYLWKKTERHDVFANKSRLEKKKYTLHPGLTDYMDRFLEEQDSNIRDRSSSPNINSLLYCDTKRQRNDSLSIDPLALGEGEVFSELPIDCPNNDMLNDASMDSIDHDSRIS